MATVTPDPGSHIWRRKDPGRTSFKYQLPGSAVYEKFPGATEWEKDRADAKQPGYLRMYNGPLPSEGQPDNGFDIDRRLSSDPCVVIARNKPTWGKWEELETWETS